jgi:hypothetical protein
MALETNKHVHRLSLYVPFQPALAQIYEESTTLQDAPVLETRALQFVAETLKSPTTRVVILTGDAGHGKTHLCRRLIEEASEWSGEAALRTMKEFLRGEESVPTSNGWNLRVVKDLSELGGGDAAKILEDFVRAAPASTDRVIVCANEGKLRHVLAGNDVLKPIRAALDEGLRSGVTTQHGVHHVVNLNFQSTTAAGTDTPSLLDSLLAQWVGDGRKWKTCDRCDVRDQCPIVSNREQLAGAQRDDGLAKRRRDGLRVALRLVEETGQSITIRELLILVAYLITGGLSCKQVHDRVGSEPASKDWQWRYAYHQSLFQPCATKDQRKSLSVLDHFERIDPGQRAIRAVDEALSTGAVERNEPFRPPLDPPYDRGPRTRKEGREDAERQRALMAFLRRRDFFEEASNQVIDVRLRREERLGFRYYEDFDFLRGTSPEEQRRRLVACRDKILSGLHAVQGIHSIRSRTEFLVLDPAFGRTQNSACVIARTIQSTSVRIESESSDWTRRRGRGNITLLSNALNWIDRRLVLSFVDSDTTISLDLFQFEYVMRAADGLTCRGFFRADIRRLMARLAALVETTRADESNISVLVDGRVRSVTIDHGLLRSGEG